MILLIRMKNATSAPRVWVGMMIMPGDYYTIESNEKEQWENNTDVLESIRLGELVVNDGINDLTPDDGKMRLQAETDSQHILYQRSGFVSKTAYDGIAEASSMCTGLVGFCFQADYTRSGELLVDSYLTRGGVESFQVPFDSIIRAVAYSGNSAASDVDIQLVIKSPSGQELTMTVCRVRGSLAMTVTDLDEAVLDAGTQIKVYARRAGRNPQNLAVSVMFQSVSNNKVNI